MWVNQRLQSAHHTRREGASAYYKKTSSDFVGHSFEGISFGNDWVGPVVPRQYRELSGKRSENVPL